MRKNNDTKYESQRTLCESQQGVFSLIFFCCFFIAQFFPFFFFCFSSFGWMQGINQSTSKLEQEKRRRKKWKKKQYKDFIKCKTNLRCKQLDTTPSLVTTNVKKNFLFSRYLQQISRNMMVRI